MRQAEANRLLSALCRRFGAVVEAADPDEIPPVDTRFLDDYYALWTERVEALKRAAEKQGGGFVRDLDNLGDML